jgi:hypothetical protein
MNRKPLSYRSIRPILVQGLTLLMLMLISGCTWTIQDPRQMPEIKVYLAPNLPENYVSQFSEMFAESARPRMQIVEQPTQAQVEVQLAAVNANSVRIMERFFAAVVPFATVTDDISLEELLQRWQGNGQGSLFVTQDAANLLAAHWGPTAATVVAGDALQAALESTPGAVGILSFDRLHPRLKVLTVDGINVLSNQLDPASYPLSVGMTVDGEGAEQVATFLSGLVVPYSNRNPDRLTTLIMTGVTAMSRATAARMELMGVLYPAAIISDTLAAADITHISNEVPFLDDCVVNNTVNNLILCSHTSYWAALEAVGTDIVGLSGNHVNDFGREGARRSLQFYRDNEIPIYGSGLTVEEACAPLYWEHNGNRFAFLAALAFGPPGAWVNDTEPGACYYYEHKEMLLDSIRTLAQEVDIVAVELQFEETYNPWPTPTQVSEFRELRAAGAEIVTGVQSHVPQALEPYGYLDQGGPGMIVYGLGNFFFDQMWSWETRTELYARHTIYNGHVISTEILTGVLEEYAQPRWATPEERASILQSIFAAAPAR